MIIIESAELLPSLWSGNMESSYDEWKQKFHAWLCYVDLIRLNEREDNNKNSRNKATFLPSFMPTRSFSWRAYQEPTRAESARDEICIMEVHEA